MIFIDDSKLVFMHKNYCVLNICLKNYVPYVTAIIRHFKEKFDAIII